MRQYTPMPACREYPEINRPLTSLEYRKVAEHAARLGLSATHRSGVRGPGYIRILTCRACLAVSDCAKHFFIYRRRGPVPCRLLLQPRIFLESGQKCRILKAVYQKGRVVYDKNHG